MKNYKGNIFKFDSALNTCGNLIASATAINTVTSPTLTATTRMLTITTSTITLTSIGTQTNICSTNGVEIINTETPKEYSLWQNYPNPFNPVTKIKFDIKNSVVSSQESVVTLKVFDILGKEIATLLNEQLQPGTYEVTFDARQPGLGSNLPSGVYFYQLKSENPDASGQVFTDTKKLTLLK